jgi:hypothetical protein
MQAMQPLVEAVGQTACTSGQGYTELTQKLRLLTNTGCRFTTKARQTLPLVCCISVAKDSRRDILQSEGRGFASTKQTMSTVRRSCL